MMKKTNKSAFVLHRFTYNFLIFAALIMAMIFTTGCNQGNDDVEEQKFITENIGGENSGFQIFKTGTTDIPTALATYKSYVKNLTANFNNLDENTKNYLRPYLDAVKNNDYTNLDRTMETVYNNCDYIFTDLIQSFKYNGDDANDMTVMDKRNTLCYTTIALTNESFKRGGTGKMNGNMNAGYNEMLNWYIKNLRYCDMTETDVHEDIENNNCARIAAELNNVLSLAVANLNTEKGLQLTTAHAQQLVNMAMSATAMQNVHDYTKQNTNVYLRLSQTMVDAITENYLQQN